MESVVEEEYGGGGTISALLRGYKADAAVIGEPTGSDAVCAGGGGSRFFSINILGKPEWPHLAHYGVNAIGLAAKVYDSLLELNERRVRRLQGIHPLFEKLRSGNMRGPGRATNMTIGTLRAGDWPATVAGWAVLEGRVGFPPSEVGDSVMKEIEKAVSELAESDGWMKDHRPSVSWWGARREAYELSQNEAIVQILSSCAKELRGNCEIYATSSASDASYLTPKVGPYGGIPTVWYGPAGDGAHSSDEYVEIDDVISVTKALASLILDWCGVAP